MLTYAILSSLVALYVILDCLMNVYVPHELQDFLQLFCSSPGITSHELLLCLSFVYVGVLQPSGILTLRSLYFIPNKSFGP
jgi:hypothetical protein